MGVSMKVIRYWTSHPDKSPHRWMNNFELDPNEFSLVYDAGDPDYVFVTEHVYVDNLQKKRFCKYVNESRVLIYYADECIFPDMNVFDYAVTFDRGISLGDRMIRRPPLSFVSELFSQSLPLYRRSVPSSVKERFCNFIYSNSCAHHRRDEIFRLLSRYRKVDSLGSHLNNMGNLSTRAESNWGDLLVGLKRPYKFSIACENARYPGYLTEKLISSFMAQTIPIYWGDPDCTMEFNVRAFIDASCLTDDELLARVAEIDANDALWFEMLAEPVMTDLQVAEYQKQDAAYRAFMRRVFSVSTKDAKRAPSGFWPDNYSRYFRAAMGVPITRRERILARCGRSTEIADGVLRYLRGG